MLAEWITQGVAAGIRIFCAGFTLIVICGLTLGIIGLIAALAKEIGNGNDHTV